METTYTEARAHLAALLDRVSRDREPVIIRRRNGEDVALIAADELSSLLESVHLIRSPANAERLLAALARAKEGTTVAQSVESLREELGLADR
ncbi:MAG: type II toxin-antitoxin system Phd/YefM family antitoxin [Thermomicrobiales bacterium]